jgi:hypothetical protein
MMMELQFEGITSRITGQQGISIIGGRELIKCAVA